MTSLSSRRDFLQTCAGSLGLTYLTGCSSNPLAQRHATQYIGASGDLLLENRAGDQLILELSTINNSAVNKPPAVVIKFKRSGAKEFTLLSPGLYRVSPHTLFRKPNGKEECNSISIDHDISGKGLYLSNIPAPSGGIKLDLTINLYSDGHIKVTDGSQFNGTDGAAETVEQLPMIPENIHATLHASPN